MKSIEHIKDIRCGNLIRPLVGLVIIQLLVSACGVDMSTGNDISGSEERRRTTFIILSIEKSTTDIGIPSLTIMVENTGNESGWNVHCHVVAKRWDVVVDSGIAYFAGGHTIEPGEQVVGEAVFANLKSHDDYRDLVYDFEWLAETGY